MSAFQRGTVRLYSKGGTRSDRDVKWEGAEATRTLNIMRVHYIPTYILGRQRWAGAVS